MCVCMCVPACVPPCVRARLRVCVLASLRNREVVVSHSHCTVSTRLHPESPSVVRSRSRTALRPLARKNVSCMKEVTRSEPREFTGGLSKVITPTPSGRTLVTAGMARERVDGDEGTMEIQRAGRRRQWGNMASCQSLSVKLWMDE